MTGTAATTAASAPKGATPSVLSQAELERFERDGFLVPRFRFSPADVRVLQELTHKLAEDDPTSPDIVVNCPHASRAGKKADPRWMDYAAHPQVLDMIEQIMGPDII